MEKRRERKRNGERREMERNGERKRVNWRQKGLGVAIGEHVTGSNK